MEILLWVPCIMSNSGRQVFYLQFHTFNGKTDREICTKFEIYFNYLNIIVIW